MGGFERYVLAHLPAHYWRWEPVRISGDERRPAASSQELDSPNQQDDLTVRQGGSHKGQHECGTPRPWQELQKSVDDPPHAAREVGRASVLIPTETSPPLPSEAAGQVVSLQIQV